MFELKKFMLIVKYFPHHFIVRGSEVKFDRNADLSLAYFLRCWFRVMHDQYTWEVLVSL